MDESEIDRSINRIQQKIKQINNTTSNFQTSQGSQGQLSRRAEYAQRAFQSTSVDMLQKESRALEKRQREESVAMLQKQRELKQIEKAEGSITKEKQRQIELLKQEINLRSKNVMEIESSKRRIDSSVQSMTGAPGGPAGPGGPGGGSGAGAAAGGGAGGIRDVMGRIASALSPMALASAMVGAVNTYGQYLSIQQTREREVEAYSASQMRNQNIAFQGTMAGQGFMNALERPERARALDMALEERSARLDGDPIRAAGRVGMSALAGAGAGGAIGLMGSGGTFSLPLAAAGAAVGVGRSVFGDKGIFRQMFDREAYEADVNAETFQNFRYNLESQKVLNPEKFEASKQFGQRMSRIQSLQRRLNISDEEMFGQGIERFTESDLAAELPDAPERDMGRIDPRRGMYKELPESRADFQKRAEEYNQALREAREAQAAEQEGKGEDGFLQGLMLDRGGNRAFSEERINRNIQQIFQAGGSTEFQRQGGSTMAAEFQRAGLTNAASELGTLSGFGTSAEETEQQYIRLLSEGVRLGFNASEPSEEMRKYTQIATKMFEQTQGAEGAVRQLGFGMAGTDTQDIKAAQSVFGMMSQKMGQSTGLRGALKQNYLRTQQGMEDFEGVDENLKQLFTEMSPENLDANNLLVRRAAEQAGVEPEEMVERISNMQRDSLFFSEGSREAADNLKKEFGKFQEANPEMKRAEALGAFTGGAKGERLKIITEALGAFGIQENDVGGLGSESLEALTGQLIGGNFGEIAKKDLADIDLDKKGRLTDEFEASTAADNIAQLEVVARKQVDLLTAVAKNSSDSLRSLIAIAQNTSALDALKEIGKLGDEAGGKALEELLLDSKDRFNYVEVNQPNTGAESE